MIEVTPITSRLPLWHRDFQSLDFDSRLLERITRSLGLLQYVVESPGYPLNDGPSRCLRAQDGHPAARAREVHAALHFRLCALRNRIFARLLLTDPSDGEVAKYKTEQVVVKDVEEQAAMAL